MPWLDGHELLQSHEWLFLACFIAMTATSTWSFSLIRQAPSFNDLLEDSFDNTLLACIHVNFAVWMGIILMSYSLVNRVYLTLCMFVQKKEEIEHQDSEINDVYKKGALSPEGTQDTQSMTKSPRRLQPTFSETVSIHEEENTTWLDANGWVVPAGVMVMTAISTWGFSLIANSAYFNDLLQENFYKVLFLCIFSILASITGSVALCQWLLWWLFSRSKGPTAPTESEEEGLSAYIDTSEERLREAFLRGEMYQVEQTTLVPEFVLKALGEFQPRYWRLADIQEHGEQVIGRGAYGRVYRKILPGGHVLAVKAMPRGHPMNNSTGVREKDYSIQKELALFAMASTHKRVINYFGHILTDDSVYVIMENACMDLRTAMNEAPDSMSEMSIKSIAIQLIRVVRRLQKVKMVHRDIKPENVLLMPDGSIRLADFGIAKRFTGDDEMCREQCGTRIYASPEILQHDFYSYKIDTWGIGVVIYMLLHGGQRPFRMEHTDEFEAKKLEESNIINGRMEWCPTVPAGEEAYNFVAGLLDEDPESRLSATQALYHEWLVHD